MGHSPISNSSSPRYQSIDTHPPPSHNHYNMSKSRVPLALGLGAAGGIGYYLYAAGGNAKAAENKFESDMHKVSANVKSHVPGRSPNAERDGTHLGAQAGAKIDTAVRPFPPSLLPIQF